MRQGLLLIVVLQLIISCTTKNAEKSVSTLVEKQENQDENEDTVFYEDADVQIIDAWARVAPLNGMTAAYMTVKWKNEQSDSLVQFYSSVCKRHEIHETYEKGEGVKGMRQINGLALEKDSEAILEPGGAHFMLMGLQKELLAEDSVVVQLMFKTKEFIEFKVPVRSLIQ